MLIDKATVMLAKHVASHDNTRFNLTGVSIEPNGTTIATDGHMLGVLAPPNFDEKEFPQGTGDGKVQHAAILDAGGLSRLGKMLPKRTRLPILDTARLSVNGTATADVAMGGELPVSSLPMPLLESEFADWRQVVPQEKPEYRITFNPALLADLFEVFKTVDIGPKGTTPAVTMEFFGAAAPIRITSRRSPRFAALLMPARE